MNCARTHLIVVWLIAAGATAAAHPDRDGATHAREYAAGASLKDGARVPGGAVPAGSQDSEGCGATGLEALKVRAQASAIGPWAIPASRPESAPGPWPLRRRNSRAG
jgi:hypothetical protein